MKKIIFFTLIFMISLFSINSYSTPSYTVKIMNINYVTSNTLEFDIYLAGNLDYKNAQFIFNFNPAIANGGTLSFTRSPGSIASVTDLPYEPYAKSSVTGNQLKFFPVPDRSPVTISDISLGKKIIRMRLSTTAASFSGTFSDMNLSWDVSSEGPLYKTKVFYSEFIDDIENVYMANLQGSFIYEFDIKYILEAMYPVLDSVQINLRNSASPYQVVDSAVTFTTIEGTHFRSLAGFKKIQPGSSYYIEVKHRNSIATWSAAPVLFSGVTTNYDFTSASGQAYGGNMVMGVTAWGIFSGNVIQDVNIDLSDVIQVYNDASNFLSGNVIADLNGDRVVDLSDLTIVYNNSNKFVSVQRP